MILPKPADMFDRDWEWRQLCAFAQSDQPTATLGVVSGRRRQGKTFLLESLCEATGGFIYAPTEAVPRQEALRQLGIALARYQGSPGDIRFHNWGEAIDALLALATERPVPVVLDEFPYLVRDAKELPSVIQKALAPRRPERRASKARLLLCGSSISFMGGLLAGAAPLRGRAALELVVPTFNFRLAKDFWKIKDPRLAALVYFILGGTPAYQTEYLQGVGPTSIDNFDEWVVEHILNPASPLFREVRALLAEDPALRDIGLYHTVLAAVAEGNATRGGIANRIERKATDISHHLTVLEDAGLLVTEHDAFRSNRSEFRITEPLVRFYHVIMRPYWTQLERVRPGRSERIWRSSRSRFDGNVAGPVFERMCRLWAEDMADDDTFQGTIARVRSGVVHDKVNRTGHGVDVAVFDPDGALLSIGEVKWGEVMGLGHLRRLEEIADILEMRDMRPRVLTLFSGAGFMPALREVAAGAGGRVQLVDLDRLYAGQ
ncbi:ATP-binding protein [Sinosporangium siamense]|uniref:ATPase AAA n=1 Tax=Sinosporangium siamense TaxID=1367973 RepID=A0A919RJI1_9ACTN|nr:ATP-binding protein [Sinosporangium siamense]GII95005.1 ATPase AAA [Sinosporangium siamense]